MCVCLGFSVWKWHVAALLHCRLWRYRNFNLPIKELHKTCLANQMAANKRRPHYEHPSCINTLVFLPQSASLFFKKTPLYHNPRFCAIVVGLQKRRRFCSSSNQPHAWLPWRTERKRPTFEMVHSPEIWRYSATFICAPFLVKIRGIYIVNSFSVCFILLYSIVYLPQLRLVSA